VRFGYAIVCVEDPERTADFWEVAGLELGVRDYELGKGHAIDSSKFQIPNLIVAQAEEYDGKGKGDDTDANEEPPPETADEILAPPEAAAAATTVATAARPNALPS
jgi:hypothetical protein